MLDLSCHVILVIFQHSTVLSKSCDWMLNKGVVLQATSYGTIPYLGTFLTDLTMIDTAIPDTVADGLINFDKKRKEFEVLAQVRVRQNS